MNGSITQLRENSYEIRMKKFTPRYFGRVFPELPGSGACS